MIIVPVKYDKCMQCSSPLHSFSQIPNTHSKYSVCPTHAVGNCWMRVSHKKWRANTTSQQNTRTYSNNNNNKLVNGNINSLTNSTQSCPDKHSNEFMNVSRGLSSPSDPTPNSRASRYAAQFGWRSVGSASQWRWVMWGRLCDLLLIKCASNVCEVLEAHMTYGHIIKSIPWHPTNT